MSQVKHPGGEDDDPYRHIRENRTEVESLAEQQRDDSLAAWARVLLALTDGEQPDDEDLEKAGLPKGGAL